MMSTWRSAHTMPPWSVPCASVARRNATARPGCRRSERAPSRRAVNVVCLAALLVVIASPVELTSLAILSAHRPSTLPRRGCGHGTGRPLQHLRDEVRDPLTRMTVNRPNERLQRPLPGLRGLRSRRVDCGRQPLNLPGQSLQSADLGSDLGRYNGCRPAEAAELRRDDRLSQERRLEDDGGVL